MNFEILEQNDSIIKIKITNYELNIINSLRRIIISEIPISAIDFCEVYENTSCTHDDFISHRLGLIPFISTNSDKIYDISTKESLFQIDYSLDIENNSNKVIEVTSNDLVKIDKEFKNNYHKIIYNDIKPIKTKNPFLITMLNPKEKINILCKINSGIGKEHAKFEPVSVCSYELLDDITCIFHIETTGVLKPYEILLKGIELLENKVVIFKKSINSIKM